MTVKECYAKIGGDYDDVVKRLMRDALVERFMLKFLEDGSYQELVNALKEGRDEDAFRAAHTLKGICQNLSFTSLYESRARRSQRRCAAGKSLERTNCLTV